MWLDLKKLLKQCFLKDCLTLPDRRVIIRNYLKKVQKKQRKVVLVNEKLIFFKEDKSCHTSNFDYSKVAPFVNEYELSYMQSQVTASR